MRFAIEKTVVEEKDSEFPMSFKFTLFGFENKDKCRCKNNKSNKTNTSHQNKFTDAVQSCHSKTRDKNAFGRCMSRHLKK